MEFPKKISRRNQGQQAEKTAASYLKKHGLKLYRQNFYCRFGEIDLIMQDQDTWVFVEVRSRGKNAMVSAAESINSQKIHKIQKTALYFCTRFKEMPNCRFDVVAMSREPHQQDYDIQWIKDAF